MAEAEDRDLTGAEDTAAGQEGAAAEPAPAAAVPDAPPADEAVQSQPAGADEAGEAPAAEPDEAPAAEAPAAEAPAADAPAADAPAADAPAAEDGDEPAPEVRRLTELAADARYFATGKRKSAVARVIIRPGSGQFVLNGRNLETYFPRHTHRAAVMHPLEVAGFGDRVDVRARIHGGGITGQAEALRHGIARALIEADPSLRTELKRRQLLTRDPRVKERKKAGLKKARKRPQFSKR
jgi:small subunit ribosomal protein S9